MQLDQPHHSGAPEKQPLINFRLFLLLISVAAIISFPGVFIGLNSFFYRDFALFGYPIAAYHKECFWSGEVPLWNPYNNCGIPFLAQWNTMVFYPGSLLYLLLPLPWSLNFLCLVHWIAAGAGMFWLARSYLASNQAAALAGFAFMFNGLLLGSLKWPNTIAALGWMPWVAFLWRSKAHCSVKGLLYTALAGAAQMLSGGPEVILLTWTFIALDTLTQCVRTGKLVLPLLKLTTVILLVAGLSAVQLFPFFDLLQQSNREGAFSGADWSMPLYGALNFFVPLLHSFPSFHGVYAQQNQFWISSYYLPIAVLFLAMCARLPREFVYLPALGLLGLWVSLGPPAGLFSVLSSLPVFGALRFPIKFIILTVFVIPIIAAIIFARLERASKSGVNTLLAALFGLVIFICILLAFANPAPFEQPISVLKNGLLRAVVLASSLFLLARFFRETTPKLKRLYFLGLIGLAFVDGMSHLPVHNPVVPGWVYQKNIPEMKPLPRLGQSRAMVSAEAEVKLDHLLPPDPVSDCLSGRLSLFCNANLIDRIPKVDGFFSLYIKYHAEVLGLIYGQTNRTYPSLEKLMAVSQRTQAGKTLHWEERTNSLPFISTGQTPRPMPDEEALEYIRQFDPALECVVPAQTPPLSARQGTVAKISNLQVEHHRITFQAESSSATLAFLSQAFHPNWRATINDKPAEILRANHAFQALVLPEGKSVVQLTYVDNAFRIGALVSLCSFLSISFFLILTGRRG